MLACAISVVIGVVKISSIKAAMYKRDVLYTKKFAELEKIIHRDIRTILEILKK
jgi:hypothetical protein